METLEWIQWKGYSGFSGKFRAEYAFWIANNAFVSVREADALSLALNWAMNPFLNILLDYTYTDLTDLIRVRVNPDGSVDYIDEENVLTCRFQLNFQPVKNPDWHEEQRSF